MEWIIVSWPTLILMGLGLRMALRLTYGARGPEPGDPVYLVLNLTAWVFIILGVTPAVIGGAVTMVGLIVVFLAIATVIEAVVQRRAAQRRSMCRILALLMERGARLESSVLLAGQAMGGIVGSSAKRLFDAVNRGVTLPMAIKKYPGALPPEAPAYLAAGTTAEVRLAALRYLGSTEHDETAGIWRNCIDRIAYLSSVLLITAAVLTFVTIKIIPEFEKIIYEFDLDIPATTKLAINISAYFVKYLAAPLILIVAALAVFVSVVAISYLADFPALRFLSDRILRGRRNADILRIIALATEYQQPLDGVLHRVTQTYPSPLLRRKLAPAADAVGAGVDWREALAKAQIISPVEQSLLTTAERVGNLPWALREVAARRDKRAAYRMLAVLQVLYPCAILAIGAVVFLYAVSIFIPLVNMIEALSR